MENTPVTLANIISLLAADIDIFLLKEEDQETDKNITFSIDDIRNQLEISSSNVIKALSDLGYNVNEPIKPTFIPNLKF